MWTTENYCGEKVVWYSEEEYNKLKKENEKLHSKLYTSLIRNNELKNWNIRAIKNAQNYADCYFFENKKLKEIKNTCTLVPAIDSEELANKILDIIKGVSNE